MKSNLWAKIAFIWVLVWLASFFAFGQQQTPNLGLVIQTPPPMANNWSAIVNYDLQRIDSLVGPYAPNYRGNWSGSLTYSKGQFVTYPTSTGTVYMSLIDSNLNHNPSSTPLDWYALANGSGTGTVTSFAAPALGWPSWLTPAVTNSTTTPSLGVTASLIPFSALANLGANQLMGSLAGGAPGPLNVPDCHTSGVSALIWTAATGFGCNTISSGTTVNINGSPVSNPNLNGSSPSPDASFIAAAFKVSGSDAIIQIPYGTNSTPGALACDGTTTTCSGGVVSSTGSGSGVQYDPSNTNYVFTGTSFWVDDTRILGQVINVTSGSCNGATCSIVNSGNNKFSAGDWVIVSSMTGWISAPAPYGNGSWNNSGYSDIVQVSGTGLSATTFQFGSPVTATITGGSVENANQFAPMQFSRLPFANGHGTTRGIFGANHQCADLDTNYTVMFHSISPSVTGNPGYFILNGCGNDIGAGSSVATVEATLQSIWSKAHTDGWTVLQGNMIIGYPGALVTGDHTYKLSQLNDWIEGQGQSFSTTLPYCSTNCGKYWDRALDFHSVMSNLDAPNMFASNGGLGTGGSVAAANLVNEALVNKATSFKTQFAGIYYGWAGSSLPFNTGPGWIVNTDAVTDAFDIMDNTQTNVAFAADTRTTSGNIVGIRVPNILVSSISSSTNPVCPNGTGGRLTTVGCTTSGTTPNALTMDNSGTGDVSGSTFNGGTVKKISYNTIGAAPSVSPILTGTPDASGATQFKLPVAAGAASLANGELIYDSTNNNWHGWVNGADLIFYPLASGFTSGHCSQPTLHGNTWIGDDAGGPCGVSGGGSAFSAITSGTNTNTLVMGTGGSLSTSGTGTIEATSLSALSGLPAQAADTVVMNKTGGSASPTAAVMPTCTSGADLYNTSTHTWSCVSTGGTALPSPVQYTFVIDQAGSLASITSPSISVTTGNLIVAYCRYGGTGATGSVASGASVTTWHPLTTQALTGVGAQMSWGVVTSTGATTFTCTPNTSITGQSMIVMEVSGLAGTLATSGGGTASSSGTGYINVSAAGMGTINPGTNRTFAVSCASVSSTSSMFYPGVVNGSFTAIVAQSNSPSGNADAGCGVVLFPYNPPNSSTFWLYGTSMGQNVSTTAFFNY